MKHLIPLTPDQLQIVQAGLQSSLKYADSEYIELVEEIKGGQSVNDLN